MASIIRNNYQKRKDSQYLKIFYIKNIINNEGFWQTHYILQDIILTFCGLLNLLQRDKAYLYKVVYCFAYFINIVKILLDIKFSENMISQLETRWSAWEQPLLLLNTVYQHKHLALPVFYDQEFSQDKSQSFIKNELQSKSDHSISLSDNDDSEIYEEDEETISDSVIIELEQAWKTVVNNWFDMLLEESNEESQLIDLESEQEEVIVHHIINPKGKWKLGTLFINTLDAPTFIGDLKI
ncbi:32736_t:CDS:2 [Gigaspora margarita]|uniref:32736_t:CDS:1 n=1 Tax=Gigaspora margarita TaxID=4874 RepID=A0ABN7UN00_GIGMA|nr:32736_t:CDS:2 [Gigaspora margarita]